MPMDEGSGAQPNPGVFDGGPTARLQQSLGLTRPNDLRTVRRAWIVALIGWVPLAALAIAHDLVAHDGAAKSFLFDYGAFARFLVAAPMFIIAESICLPRLSRIALQFRIAGLVTVADGARYD